LEDMEHSFCRGDMAVGSIRAKPDASLCPEHRLLPPAYARQLPGRGKLRA
jgi:hypothetical protein